MWLINYSSIIYGDAILEVKKKKRREKETRTQHPRWNLSLMTLPFRSISSSDSVDFKSERLISNVPFVDSVHSETSCPLRTLWDLSSQIITLNFKHITATAIESQCCPCGPIHIYRELRLCSLEQQMSSAGRLPVDCPSWFLRYSSLDLYAASQDQCY